MKRLLSGLAVASLLVAAGAAAAQSSRPEDFRLRPLGTNRDAFNRAMPFGVPPYYAPETPLGGGAFPAVMEAEPSLLEHIVYHPADMDAAGKLPVVVWGNGACIHAGNRFRTFLTELASHGFVVISAGTMGHPALEVGPQENPVVRRPGQPAPPPSPPAAPNPDDPTTPWRSTRSTADHMRQAIDWAVAENARPGGRWQGKLDTDNIAVAGQSCGGGLATEAGADPRVKAVGIFNSGTRLDPATIMANANQPNQDPEAIAARGRTRLDAINAPVLILTGDADHDSAYEGGRQTFGYLSRPQVTYAWQDGLAHIGTYGFPGAGSIGRIAVDWFNWRLKGDQGAAKTFTGPDCVLCRAPGWHVDSKNIS